MLGLPEDMLAAECETRTPARLHRRATRAPRASNAAEKLAGAERPLMIIGGPGWSTAGQKAMQAFADRFDMPVATAFRYQDHIDNRHRCYVGHAGIDIDAKFGAAIRDADLLIVVGEGLGEMTTARLHADRHPEPGAVSRARASLARRARPVFRPDLPIVATPAPSPRRWPGSSRRPRSPGAPARASCAPPTSAR